MLNKPNSGGTMWGMDVVVTSSAGLWVPLSKRKTYRAARPLYGERCRVLGQYRRRKDYRQRFVWRNGTKSRWTVGEPYAWLVITRADVIKPAALIDQVNNRIYVHPKVYQTLLTAFQADRNTFTADDTWIRGMA